MNFSTHTESDDVEINLTSLIDIVLLLLIFFMMTTTFIQGAGINVNLPKASSVIDQQSKVEPKEIAIDKSGSIFLSGKLTTIADFKTSLQGTNLETTPIIIKADEGVSHGKVVEVMDTLNSLGAKKLSIGAKLDIRDN